MSIYLRKLIVKKLLFLAFVSLLLSGCFNNGTSIVKGNVVEVSPFYDYQVVDIRTDCKNATCEIKRFYFKNDLLDYAKTKDFTQSKMANILNAQEYDKKIIISYSDYFFVKIVQDAFMQQ